MNPRLRTNPCGGAVPSNPRWAGAFVFARINRADHGRSQMPAYAWNGRRLAPPLIARLTVLLLTLSTGCVSTLGIDTSAMSFSHEPLVGKAVWNDLVTQDLEVARRFYGELFGWTFEQTTAPTGQPYLLARSGGIFVAGMVAVNSPAKNVVLSRWLPYISVSDVDASLARATAGGATVLVGARDVSLGRVAVIEDKEGAVLGLARSRIGDPDDTTTAAGPGRVVWTELLANDPATASQFYQTVIGVTAHTIERHGGSYTLLSERATDRAGILRNPSDDAAPVWLTYFGVEDPVSAAARVAALGGKVILPPSPQLRDGTMAVVTDPTGALFALQKVGS
jgi:predicted enzyme related to lactoylglutathione lyase